MVVCSSFRSEATDERYIEDHKIFKRDRNDSFMLAGLFTARSHATTYNTKGLLRMEVAKFAIREANSHILLPPEENLGFVFYDTFNDAKRTIGQATEICLDESFTDVGAFSVKSREGSSGVYCLCSEAGSRTLGILGPSESVLSVHVAHVASHDMTPVVSWSTSASLSDKALYPSYRRTVSADTFQARLIQDLILYYQWTYISIIASDDDYGRAGLQELEGLLQSTNCCIAEELLFPTPPNSTFIDPLLEKIMAASQAEVVVLWTEGSYAMFVLERAAQLKCFHKTWIVTESLGTMHSVTKVHPHVVTGMVSVVANYGKYKEFEDYFWKIRFNDTAPNSWLREFFQMQGIQSSSSKKSLWNFRNMFSLDKVGCVRNAVYAYVHAFKKYATSNKVCLGSKCSVLPIGDYELFTDTYLKNVTFTGLLGETVKFDRHGDVIGAKYDVYILQVNKDINQLEYKRLATWTEEAGLQINASKVHWSNMSSLPPRSRCSEDCLPGFYAVFLGSSECCWMCAACPNGYVSPALGSLACTACPHGYASNINRTACRKLKNVLIKAGSIYAVGLFCTSFLGIILSAFVVVTMVTNRHQQIVRASDLILSLVQLGSQTVFFFLPALFIGEPNQAMCYARPLFIGFFLTLSTSITLAKTQKLLVIFKRSHKLSASEIRRLKSLEILIILFCVLLQTVVTSVFYVVAAPVLHVHTDYGKFEVHLDCEADVDFAVQLIYVALLTAMAAMQAFRARHLPDNYNEARKISYVTFLSTIILLLPMPLAKSGESPISKGLAVCLPMWLLNFMQMLILYGHKVWIIHFHPQKGKSAVYQSPSKLMTTIKTRQKLEAGPWRFNELEREEGV